ncbi:HotDog domain-containing protein [Ochromonadaceae sp. CCMP2298]|nr:HotDog domain-containing protein [Ochromonadaceae sp. CCMP2298]
MVEAYEVYKHRTREEIYCILKVGSRLNGYPGILHGGISALLLDTSYGWLFISTGLPPAVTANLDVNYRAPIKQNSLCILRARVDQVKGRKLYMSATLSDITGANVTGGVTGAKGVTGAGVTGGVTGVTGVVGRVCVESSTLFVTMKPWDQFLLRLGGWVGM